MPIDASIPLAVRPVQVESPLNQMAHVLGLQAAQTQNAVGQYGLAKAQRQDAQTNALMTALQGEGLDLTTPEGQRRALSIAPETAGPLIKNVMDGRVAQSTIGRNDAEADKNRVEGENKVIATYRDASQAIADPQSAIDFVTQMHGDPRLASSAIAQIPLEKALAQIPRDPAQLAAWKQQFALGATKFMELNKPQTYIVNTGSQQQVVQVPGLGGAPQLVGSMNNTVSPDAALSARTSTANTAANIQKDYNIAGINPSNPNAVSGNVEQMAQAIAAGQIAPLSGFALARPQGQTVMRRVMEINPSYDATTFTAKAAAAKAFASGAQGNALRSVATANAHLDQMGELVDALNNGNIQVFNKLANTFAAQTGSPAPTNFDAVKNIIGQEVVKAIVAGGGTGGERDEAAAAFSNAKSPAQLKGAIQHYRMVMGAQEANLLQQRDATGLPRSTLPNYSGHGQGAAPAAPTGWQYLGTVPAGGK